ncbi:MAG: RsmD family RNA methyltransferase [Candidatus Omnitrophota bacterium]|nr:methyltransferase domain-containing protein [Candidatus Omnitrophota bacterium]MBU2529093.1 RsmD family RNA methyltransferase [bacterium]MBU3930381.1 RsmD family RNA methyltransferase [bacterium]
MKNRVKSFLSVIAGKYKGRRLECADGVRPLTGLSKKSLFDILTPYIGGARFLDLFAGTGSVGLEALSRGASQSVFVEKSPRVAELIRKNFVSGGVDAGEYDIVPIDARNYLEHTSEKFDIIFIGPPYPLMLDKDFMTLVFNALKPGGIAVCQHRTGCDFGFPQKAARTKVYGVTTIDFYINE